MQRAKLSGDAKHLRVQKAKAFRRRFASSVSAAAYVSDFCTPRGGGGSGTIVRRNDKQGSEVEQTQTHGTT